MIRIPDLTIDEVNRALDSLSTDLSSRIKRLEGATTSSGASGTFTVDGSTITVVNGIITRIGD